MTDVIERLTASKRTEGDRLSKEGRMFGREWAKRRAEYQELIPTAGIIDLCEPNLSIRWT